VSDQKDISVDKHCELLTEHIRDQLKRISDAFRLFVQLFTGIVGGSIWLRVEHAKDLETSRPVFERVSNGLVFLVFFVCAILIADNLRAWRSYRLALSKAAGKAGGHPIIPPPNLFVSAWPDVVMIVAMAGAVWLFWRNNPFSV
jgi:hypothetical protein